MSPIHPLVLAPASAVSLRMTSTSNSTSGTTASEPHPYHYHYRQPPLTSALRPPTSWAAHGRRSLSAPTASCVVPRDVEAASFNLPHYLLTLPSPPRRKTAANSNSLGRRQRRCAIKGPSVDVGATSASESEESVPSFCVHDEACDRAPASSSSAGERWSSNSEEDDCLRSATEEEEENVDKSLEAQPMEDVSMTDGLETSPEAPSSLFPPPISRKPFGTESCPLPSATDEPLRSPISPSWPGHPSLLESPISLSAIHEGTFPLGQPTLKIAFCAEDAVDAVPPCFYPGQTIPTTLLFELPRYTSLPHDLNPVLTMSLIGTLRFQSPERDGEEYTERSLIDVGVSLAEGLSLWGKDAGLAWDKLSDRKKRGRQDPRLGLPGGKYTLPLTVQVPTHPKLPSSFSLPSASFEISYHLEVSLTIDTPVQPIDYKTLERIVLVRAVRPFTLLPITLPTPPPLLPTLEGLVEFSLSEQDYPDCELAAAVTAGDWVDRFSLALGPAKEAGPPLRTSLSSISNALKGVAAAVAVPLGPSTLPAAEIAISEPWTIACSIPTSSYSPSSTIPLDLTLFRQANSASGNVLPSGELLVRAELVRRERIHHSELSPLPVDQERGLVDEEVLVVSFGRFDISSLAISATTGEISLPRLIFPLGHGTGSRPWHSGYTTSLTVSPEALTPFSTRPAFTFHSHCSSRFYLAVHVGFSPTQTSLAPCSNEHALIPTSALPSSANSIPKDLRSRSLLVPIVIGSVGEPNGARYHRTWRELYLEREEGSSSVEERPRMISGSAIDEEGGWLYPPPSYQSALLEEEYMR